MYLLDNQFFLASGRHLRTFFFSEKLDLTGNDLAETRRRRKHDCDKVIIISNKCECLLKQLPSRRTDRQTDGSCCRGLAGHRSVPIYNTKEAHAILSLRKREIFPKDKEKKKKPIRSDGLLHDIQGLCLSIMTVVKEIVVVPEAPWQYYNIYS